MNLYLRFLGFLLSLPFTKVKRDSFSNTSKFRVWPQDCDLNGHLTNSRYLAFGDLARMYATAEFGLVNTVIKNKYMIVVQSQEITYIRPIAPFAKFAIQTEFIYADEKYFYAYHQFMVKGKVMANALVRGAFLQNKKVIPMTEVLKKGNFPLDIPSEPGIVNSWKEHLRDKKKWREQ